MGLTIVGRVPAVLDESEERKARETDTEFVSFRVSADVKKPFQRACITVGTNITRELIAYMRQFARENEQGTIDTKADRLSFDDLDDEQIAMLRVVLATVRHHPKPLNLAMLGLSQMLKVNAKHYADFLSPSMILD